MFVYLHDTSECLYLCCRASMSLCLYVSVHLCPCVHMQFYFMRAYAIFIYVWQVL